MGDGIVHSERQLDQEEGEQQGVDTTEEPGSSKRDTQFLPHDGAVIERLANGHVLVISHHHQKEIAQAKKVGTKHIWEMHPE